MRRLVEVTAPLERFLRDVQTLGAESLAQTFFTALRARFRGHAACEPRHRSWFSTEAEHLLHAVQVARVAADPALMPAAAVPGGWPGLVYYRWHGAPDVYYSVYASASLDALVNQLAVSARTVPTWCIFDNTARGAATMNALGLLARQAAAPTQA